MKLGTESLRMLFTDDGVANRKSLFQSLEREFPDLFICRLDNLEALDSAMAQEVFDIAVSDTRLTWIDGLKLLKSLRRRWPRLPVIWIGHSPRPDVIVAGMKAGVTDYLSMRQVRRLPAVIRNCLDDAGGTPGGMLLDHNMPDSAPGYRALLELTSDYAYVLTLDADAHCVCAWVDERFTSITGYTRDEINQRGGLSSIIHPDDLSIVSQRRRHWMACQPDISEFRILTPSGEERWVRDATRAMASDADGLAISIYGVGQDLTQRRRSEEALRQAQTMEAISRLAGGVAHDFNNLLQVISGYSDMLLRRLKTQNALRSYAQEIKNAADQGALLTRQLMMVSHKPLLQPQMLDCQEILCTLTPVLQRLLGEDIEFVTTIEPLCGQVTADAGQFEQVILNLAVYARDSMTHGGRLTLKARNVTLHPSHGGRTGELGSGEYIQLIFSDTGCGMDAETQAHIFEPFFTTKELGKSTGLGLFTVYGIVTQNGGSLQVESTPGAGSTFIIHWPRTHAALQQHQTATGLPRSTHGTETILLVEDEAAVRDLVRHVLQAMGYTILEATNGTQALQISGKRQRPIHLLLADVVLPDLSGPEVAARLTATQPDMRVIYMSGYTVETVKRYGLPDGPCRLLQKPFTPTALLANVREALGAPPL